MIRQDLISKLGVFVATIYVAAGFGLFLSVADNYLRKSGTLPVPPTIAAVVFLASIIGFAVLRDLISRRPSVRLGILLRANLSVIFAFAMLTFLSLVLALHPSSYWGDGRKWIYLQTYDFFIFLAAMLLPALEFIRNRFRLLVIVGLLTMLGSIWYEVHYPSTFSSVPNRAAGFPGNSNWGALIIVMICSMSLRYREGASRILDLVILGISGLGIYFTFSRSGTINFVLLLIFYVIITLTVGKDRVKAFFTVTFSLLFLVAFFAVVVPVLSDKTELGDSKAENRILGLLEGEAVDDGSASDRLQAARETLDKIEQSPIIGHGTGFNRKMRQTPHNLYLKLWVDSGILGLLSWIALLVSAFWLFTARRYRPGQALLLVTTFGGFFSHNILEQRTFLFLFGTAAALSLYESAAYSRRVFAFSRVAQMEKEAIKELLEYRAAQTSAPLVNHIKANTD